MTRAGSSARPADGPLLVFGPRSLTYDFGPGHPLTPRRFGPGIDLLRAVGAEPSTRARAGHGRGPRDRPLRPRMSRPCGGSPPTRRARPAMGIGISDNPAFAGMHEAGAAVADGSLRAMEAILRGDVEHALHPGGGLHHAMPAKAWGFCIYNDPALAIVRARAAGLRVLYVDLDMHHGDGVEAISYADPGVLTVSFHESGRYLFPGTGFIDDLGEGAAAGTVGQRAARAVHRGDGVAGRGACPAADPRRGVRAGRGRLAARRRHARLGPARAPAGDDDGDGGGGAAGRSGRAPVGGRPMARDGRRRVRRVPGGAAGVGADVAGRGASRGAGRDADRVAGAVGGRGGGVRDAGDAVDLRGRAERRAVRSAPSRRPRRRQSLEILARVRAVALPRLLRRGRGPRLVVRRRRRGAVFASARQCPGAGDRRAGRRRAGDARRGCAGRQPVRRHLGPVAARRGRAERVADRGRGRRVVAGRRGGRDRGR